MAILDFCPTSIECDAVTNVEEPAEARTLDEESESLCLSGHRISESCSANRTQTRDVLEQLTKKSAPASNVSSAGS